MTEDLKKAGDYTITQAIHIGDKIIVMGENPDAAEEMYYMVSYCERNDIFAVYRDVEVGRNYLEIAGIFAKRLQEQIEKTAAELKNENCPHSIITSDMCVKNSYSEPWEGKILVVKPECLRGEYRTASHQIIRCVGGNGSSPKGHGFSIFGKRFVAEGTVRFGRTDIMGILKEECYPAWLKEAIQNEQKQQTVRKHEEAQR